MSQVSHIYKFGIFMIVRSR